MLELGAPMVMALLALHLPHQQMVVWQATMLPTHQQVDLLVSLQHLLLLLAVLLAQQHIAFTQLLKMDLVTVLTQQLLDQ
jgi:hypothetical protein